MSSVSVKSVGKIGSKSSNVKTGFYAHFAIEACWGKTALSGGTSQLSIILVRSQTCPYEKTWLCFLSNWTPQFSRVPCELIRKILQIRQIQNHVLCSFGGWPGCGCCGDSFWVCRCYVCCKNRWEVQVAWETTTDFIVASRVLFINLFTFTDEICDVNEK